MWRSWNSLKCQFSASFQLESETLLSSSLLGIMHKPTGLQKFCLYFLFFLRHTGIKDSLTLPQLFYGFRTFSKSFIEPSPQPSFISVCLVSELSFLSSSLLAMLIIDLRMAHVLNKHSTTQLYSQLEAAT